MNELEDSIRKKINKLLELKGIPGLAIGIVKKDKIAYSKEFGFKDIATKEELHTNSIFHVSSVSKIFVAIAIMQLREQEKIDLDDPLIKYLDYFKLKDSDYKEITIRQLLSHSSGLPDIDTSNFDSPKFDENALETYIRSLEDKELISPPGTRFWYSDIGFDILGDVVAKVSGLSFEEYMKKNVLLPLNMKNSTFYKNEVPEKDLVTPHIRKQKRLIKCEPYPYSRDHAPSSTLHSNVIELCNFLIANLNNGRFNGKQFLKKSTYDLLWEPLIKTNMDAHNANVGLGWFIGKYRGAKIVGHSGGEFGFLAHLFLFPEKSLGIVMLMNSFHSPEWELVTIFLDLILGYKPIILDDNQFIFFKDLFSVKAQEFENKLLVLEEKKQTKKLEIREHILKFLSKSEAGATVTRIHEVTFHHRNTIKKYLKRLEEEGKVYFQVVGSFTLWFITSSYKGIIVEQYKTNHYDFFKKFLVAYSRFTSLSEKEMTNLMMKIGEELCNMSNFLFDKYDFKLKFVKNDGTLDLLISANFIIKFIRTSELFGKNLECEIIPPFDDIKPSIVLLRVKIENLIEEGAVLLYYVNCGFINQLLKENEIPLTLTIKSLQKETETCYYELSFQ